MSLRFTKMHGLGNDFMVIDAINQSVKLSSKQIKAWGRRDTGIGFDQCLVVEKSEQAGIDFYYRIFNSDGSEVGQCGNGARCLARFIQHYGLSPESTFIVATKTTRMRLQIHADNTVTVDMGMVNFHPERIPLQASESANQYSLPLTNGTMVSVHALSVGNPHAVMPVSHLSDFDVKTLGQEISEHPYFPEQCNAGFFEILSPSTLNLRVYERGCGETQACGSGAVAAAAVGRRFYHMSERIEVHLAGGSLVIHWPDMDGPIYLTGDACFVYEGQILNY